MGEAPKEYTVTAIIGDKVKVDGIAPDLDIVPRGTPVSHGQVRGWFNPNGKFGPYLKIAEERQQSNGGAPRSDQRSARIERQHSQEMALRAVAALGEAPPQVSQKDLRATIKDWTDFFVADLDNASARAGSPNPPAQIAEDASEGAVQGASSSDDIPF